MNSLVVVVLGNNEVTGTLPVKANPLPGGFQSPRQEHLGRAQSERCLFMARSPAYCS